MDDLAIDVLAEIWHANRYRSRRLAKRTLRDLGAGELANAAGLDSVLDFIKQHPRRLDIIDAAAARESAALEAARTRAIGAADDTPEWLVAETPHWGRTFVVHICPGGTNSFIGEVFDRVEQAPGDIAPHALDAGQCLSNILWLDGDRPETAMVSRLMADARRQVRIYDMGLENYNRDEPGE